MTTARGHCRNGSMKSNFLLSNRLSEPIRPLDSTCGKQSLVAVGRLMLSSQNWRDM